MIRVRIDDVLWESSGYDKVCTKRQIQKIHRWLVQTPSKIIHVPTILVTEIAVWPDVVDWIREETAEGRMSPQLHGYTHKSYDDMPQSEIEEHLELSIEWFRKNIGIEPTVWATPWGGTSEKIKAAAAKFFLKVETTENTMSPGTALRIARRSGSLEVLNGSTIMEHWWKRGLQLLRIVEIGRCGSYEAAVEYDKATRKERIFGENV